jgi:NTE family protein
LRHLNLILQGGGVKGIAYAGALQSLLLDDDFKVHGVGGTSAGSLVAALLAIGMRGRELENLLQDRELFQLLSREEANRYTRLKIVLARRPEWESAIEGFGPIWAMLHSRKRFKEIRAFRALMEFRDKHSLLKDLPKFWEDLSGCWSKKGLHDSAPLRKWLNKHLRDATFESVYDSGRGFDLRIVAADVGHRKYLVYDRQKYGGTEIARAVHASVSVPIFFSPLEANDGECLVDGGVLSNFPSFLFDKSPYPTVGFRLRDGSDERTATTTPLGYLQALVETMATAHDEFRDRDRLQSFRRYDILTPPKIKFDSFDLTGDDVTALFNAGLAAASQVDWTEEHHSSEEELVKYFDPSPHVVLTAALRQAEALITEHLNPSLVSEIEQTVKVTVRIDRDWSSHYRRTDAIRVKGDGVLLLQRARVTVRPEVGRSLSLSETKPECVEETGPAPKPLRYIPAYNADNEKGFALFFSPPIMAQAAARVFSQELKIDQEFAKTLGTGASTDTVSVSVVQRATIHRLSSARLEVLVPSDFPHLKFDPDPTATAVITTNGTEHREYVWEFPAVQINGKFEQEVGVRRAPKAAGRRT